MATELFAAATKHQQEIRSATELREQGYRIELPKRHRQVVVGRRVEVVTGLRFPGYIFVHFDLAAGEGGPINNTRGIAHLLPPGERPRPLQADWLPELLRHIDEEFELASGRSKPDPRADLHHGDIVQINLRGHPFDGKQGEYSRTERCVAIVHIGFGVVRIPEIHLEKIEVKNPEAS